MAAALKATTFLQLKKTSFNLPECHSSPSSLTNRSFKVKATMAALTVSPTVGLSETFSRLKQRGKVALIPYITAGDPDLSTTAQVLKVLDSCGSDIIELGMPYSDPLADGPVIQAASTRSLARGTNFDKIIEMLKEVVPQLSCPIALFSYYNPILKRGVENFMTTLNETGVHGLVVPDVPLEETEILRTEANKKNIELTWRSIAEAARCAIHFLHHYREFGKCLVLLSGFMVICGKNEPVIYQLGDGYEVGDDVIVRMSLLSRNPLHLIGSGMEFARDYLSRFDSNMSPNQATAYIYEALVVTSLRDPCCGGDLNVWKVNEIGIEKKYSMHLIDAMVYLRFPVMDQDTHFLIFAKSPHTRINYYVLQEHLVLLTTPTTPNARMKAIVEASEGFVYLVSSIGVTGARASVSANVQSLLQEIKKATDKPLAVGFGISKPEHVKQVASWGADGVIVGSAMVKILAEAKSPEEGLKEIENFTKRLKSALQ